MASPRVHSAPRRAVSAASVWAIARRQHGVVSRAQLLELGLHPQAIKHRVAKGRLHRIRRSVYVVGRPELTRRGGWMAAVLACGPGALLSHASAAALWGIVPTRTRAPAEATIDVSVPRSVRPRLDGVHVHRRALADVERTLSDGIPVTMPARTLIDVSVRLRPAEIEAAVNAADKRDLIDPGSLSAALEGYRGQRGVAALRAVLDRRTFRLTDSELERRFLRLVRRAGLPMPETGRYLNGFKVDFHWPALGLVVETDGLRYHRTPAQQARDRERDQAHARAGMTTLRFTHEQIRFEPDQVARTLAAVVRGSETRASGAG
ncbi:MAG TPA: type IV toxin-antitoxin system AbiEi family antitoxin domain-containing protein [Solirubrobacterales bacterium]|jgi:very-short-patch-repair endonuclease|nr:type IV toxin-antitoxin system AbiEi family antitoxin domain-containing protein [Solirubrobacterales bacterium]